MVFWSPPNITSNRKSAFCDGLSRVEFRLSSLPTEFLNTEIHGCARTLFPDPSFNRSSVTKLRASDAPRRAYSNLGGTLKNVESSVSPRFDRLIGNRPRQRRQDEPFRLLVTTARMPGFTTQQLDLVKRSLQDLKFWASQHRHLNGIRLELVWRLTQELDTEISVPNHLTELSGSEPAETLNNVDAVITTPSTTMLEAMLKNLPVALLDYNNCPHYVRAAWTISAPRHLDHLTSSWSILLQRRCCIKIPLYTTPWNALPPLHYEWSDWLRKWCVSHSIVEDGTCLFFPPRILTDHHQGYHLPEERFDMRALYPDHPGLCRYGPRHTPGSNCTAEE